MIMHNQSFQLTELQEMKGMRERVARKLKSISNLKQGLVDQCKQLDILPYNISSFSEFINNVQNEDFEVMDDDVEQHSSLSDFEEKCPPGGVILYTTSLRGIRKTFEDCSTIRFLLESFRILYIERDVSMHMEFREELWRMMKGKVVPPRLFVRGRLIGGADEVVGLHEQGKLSKLLEGIPKTAAYNCPCHGCAGLHFIVCVKCNGSRKMRVGENPVRCPDCNENGLVQCPICT